MSYGEPMASQVAAVREIYAGINRNDIESAVQGLDAHVDWIEPVEYTGSGAIHGREAVAAHLKQARARWAEGTCDVEQLKVVGDRIVVLLRVHVRLKDETQFREGAHSAVYSFRNGKATEMRIFEDPNEALRWAGAR